MKQDIENLFDKQQIVLTKAILKLEDAYKKIIAKDIALFSEEERFEILTTRFSRLSDLYTQKLLGLLFRLLQEPDLSFIDKCHYLEKLNLVDKASTLYEIRELRNQISHEYALETLDDINKLSLEKTSSLISIVKLTSQYMEKLIKKIDI